MNVGQTNNQVNIATHTVRMATEGPKHSEISRYVKGGQGGNYDKPSYDTPTYAAILIPDSNVIGNKFDAQTLGQVVNFTLSRFS